MQGFKKIDPKDLDFNPFHSLKDRWMLITAQKEDGSVNSMTASWGGFGIMWRQPVAYVVIRPQRFTKEFVDNSKKLSLAFFDEHYREDLNYLGTTSGRDVANKIDNTKLTVEHKDNIPYFKEAELIFLCDVLSETELKPEEILEKELIEKHYADNDFHHLYIVRINEIYSKK